MNPLWNVWNDHPSIKLPGNYTLQGFSIAALRTNFYVNELGLMLDAGISGNFSPDYICVTHGHADHSANLPCHLYSKKDGKIQILVPKDSTDKFGNFIDSSIVLGKDNQIADEKDLDMRFHDVIGVVGDDRIDAKLRGKDFSIEVIECYHSIPCVGFGFIEKRKKLKTEYSKLPGKEIALLRKSGTDVNETIELNQFCFLGDTSKEVLEKQWTKLKKYKCIMIECTFIKDEDYDQADKTKHIHWKDLESYVRENQDISFILFHFSQRYKKAEIVSFFDDLNYKNVQHWAN